MTIQAFEAYLDLYSISLNQAQGQPLSKKVANIGTYQRLFTTHTKYSASRSILGQKVDLRHRGDHWRHFKGSKKILIFNEIKSKK